MVERIRTWLRAFAARVRDAAGFRKRRRTLEELAGITDENRHEEVDWGPPRGREIVE